MGTELVKWAGRAMVAVFGGAFVLAIVVAGVQAYSRLQEWVSKQR